MVKSYAEKIATFLVLNKNIDDSEHEMYMHLKQ